MELDFEKPLVEIEEKLAELTRLNESEDAEGNYDSAIAELKKTMRALKREIYSNLTPWQTVQIARHPDRPLIRDYIKGMTKEFIELHGDRLFGDDQAIIAGFATIENTRVMFMGHQKGRSVEENVVANFGMANPEGYRKALRLMELAEKFNLPVVTLIDTPGAYPGAEAEARGQAEAIGKNLVRMSNLGVPIITVVTGEGGSGGALGIGMGDVVMMLSNSVYSVISPEGCASILWRDGAKAPEAAKALQLTANSLLKLKLIDEIIEEPVGGAHRAREVAIESVKKQVLHHLKKLKGTSPRRLIDRRYEKYRNMGKPA